MISVPAMASATARARRVLPVAVGPPMTSSGGKSLLGDGTDERIRAGVLDAHVDHLPNKVGRACEMDELVVPVAARHPRRCVPAGFVRTRGANLVDQHLGRRADPLLVRSQTDPLLQVEQRLQPALLF